MSQLVIGFFLSITATILFAVTNILIGRSLQKDKLIEGIFITIIFSTIIIFIFAFVSGELSQISSLSPIIWLLYIATGLLNFALARTFNYSGIAFLGPSRNSAIVSTRILFASFFAMVFIGEQLNVISFVGVIFAFTGVVLVSLSQESNTEFRKIGLIFPLMTAIFVGIAVVLIRSADVQSNLPIDGVLIAYLTASILYLPAVSYKQLTSTTIYSFKMIIILAIAGLMSGIAQMSRYIALQVAPVVLVASIVATAPLGTMILSFFFNKKYEILNWKLALGSIISVFGVILISLSLNAI